MHGYSLGPVEELNRKKVNRALFGLSILFTPLVNKLLVLLIAIARNNTIGEATVDWLISVGVTISISYIMTYVALFFLVDKHFFRRDFLRDRLLGISDARHGLFRIEHPVEDRLQQQEEQAGHRSEDRRHHGDIGHAAHHFPAVERALLDLFLHEPDVRVPDLSALF